MSENIQQEEAIKDFYRDFHLLEPDGRLPLHDLPPEEKKHKLGDELLEFIKNELGVSTAWEVETFPHDGNKYAIVIGGKLYPSLKVDVYAGETQGSIHIYRYEPVLTHRAFSFDQMEEAKDYLQKGFSAMTKTSMAATSVLERENT